MEEPNQGLQPIAEPSLTAVPQEDGTTQPNSQPQQTSTPEASKLQELETQLQAERNRAQNLEQLARTQQSRADQATARMQALAGVVPKQDPLAQDVEYFVKNGINADDARLFAGFVNQKMGAVQQQYQQQTQALQATTMVSDVLNNAYQQDPSLFSEQIYSEVQSQLRQDALQGNSQFMNPEYALDLAAIAQSRAARANRGNPQAQQYQQPQRQQQYPAPSHQQSIPSMMNQGSGFRAQMPVPQAKANAPLVDKIANDMQAYWDPNYKPSTPQQH